MKTASTIKTVIAAATLFLSNFTFASFSTDKPTATDTSLCLILKGKVTKGPQSAGVSYTVQLVDNSTVVKSKVVKAGSKFEFKLKKNNWYAVKVLRDGCAPKFISVTTHNLPAEMTEEDMYIVNFDLADPVSYDEAKYLDADAVDFPLAIIAYNRSIDSFDYNEEYTKNIKSKLVSGLSNESVLASEK